MSETLPTLQEQLLTLTRQFQAQARATEKLTRTLEQVKAEAAESKKALETKVEQQGQTIKSQGQTIGEQGEQIELLKGEVRGLKETSSSSSSITAARPSEDVQTGKIVRMWKIVFVVGAMVPHGFALASLKYGDMRLVAASRMFEMFGSVCSIAAVCGNPRNFGSRNEKLFIGLCALSLAAYYAILAYALGSTPLFIRACVNALILPPCYLGAVKLYSKFSDRKLGAAITALFKSLPGALIPMLYISAESLRCIMDSTADVKLDEDGNIKRCGNPSQPTWWVSVFLTASWGLTYVIPPLLPSDRTMTWSDVMNLNMGRIEGLQFILFSTFSILALVLYALTNEEGTELGDFLEGLILVMVVNFGILSLVVLYEYVLKPAICRPTTRSHDSDSETSPNSDAFSFESSGNSINVL